jgi:chromosome segregation ATPase
VLLQLREEKTGLLTKLQDLESKSSGNDSQIEIASLKSQIDGLKLSYTSEVESLRSQLEFQQKENEDLRNELKSAPTVEANAVHNLESKLLSSQRQYDEMIQKYQGLQQQHEALGNENRSLKLELETKHAELLTGNVLSTRLTCA